MAITTVFDAWRMGSVVSNKTANHGEHARQMADEILDIVSSDQVPSALLSSALLPGDLRGDVARGIRTVTSAPAAAVGLADRGRLEVTTRADLIRVARIEGASALRGTWVQGRRVGWGGIRTKLPTCDFFRNSCCASAIRSSGQVPARSGLISPCSI